MADTIRAMRAAGVPDDKIIETVLVMEDERLARGRARTAKCRINKKRGNACDVTRVTGVTKEKAVSPRPPSEKENTPLSPPMGAHSPQRNATRLADDWTLPDEWRAWALEEGWPAERVAFEADQFRDYWHAAGGQNSRKRDWLATWRNWMRKVPKTNGNTARKADSPHDKAMAGFAAASRGEPN